MRKLGRRAVVIHRQDVHAEDQRKLQDADQETLLRQTEYAEYAPIRPMSEGQAVGRWRFCWSGATRSTSGRRGVRRAMRRVRRMRRYVCQERSGSKVTIYALGHSVGQHIVQHFRTVF